MSHNKKIVYDFKRGLSIVGLARKYGRTMRSVERTIRRWMNLSVVIPK